jgi:hypothetical protein
VQIVVRVNQSGQKPSDGFCTSSVRIDAVVVKLTERLDVRAIYDILQIMNTCKPQKAQR